MRAKLARDHVHFTLVNMVGLFLSYDIKVAVCASYYTLGTDFVVVLGHVPLMGLVTKRARLESIWTLLQVIFAVTY